MISYNVDSVYAEEGRFEYHPASKDRTHVDPLRTRQKDVAFAKGGDAGLLSRTSRHEQDLHQTQNWFRAFQNSSSRHSVSNCGGTAAKKS